MGSIVEMLMGIIGGSGGGSGGLMSMFGGGGSSSPSNSFGVMKSDMNSAPPADSGFMSQLAGSQVGTSKMSGSSMGSVGGQSKDMYGVSTSAMSPYTMMSHLNNVNPVNQPQPEFDPDQLMSLMTRLTGGSAMPPSGLRRM